MVTFECVLQVCSISRVPRMLPAWTRCHGATILISILREYLDKCLLVLLNQKWLFEQVVSVLKLGEGNLKSAWTSTWFRWKYAFMIMLVFIVS